MKTKDRVREYVCQDELLGGWYFVLSLLFWMFGLSFPLFLSAAVPVVFYSITIALAVFLFLYNYLKMKYSLLDCLILLFLFLLYVFLIKQIYDYDITNDHALLDSIFDIFPFIIFRI